MKKEHYAMKKKFRLVFFMLGLLTSVSALAAEKGATALKVSLKDGTTATYVLSSDTKITFENANMCFSSRDWKFEVPVSDLTNWTYDLPFSSIDGITDGSIVITQDDNVLTISGAPVGSHIEVYAVDGKRMAAVTSSSVRENISTESWVTGVYVVKVNDRTFKIAKL